MPEINVKRQGITSFARDVPTSTALIVQPMNLQRVGKEAATEDETPERIDDLNHAFKVFKPQLHFKSEGPTEIEVDLEFNKMADFDPKNILKPTPNKRNDLAKLQTTIELLYRLKERWGKPGVRRAWNDKMQRQQIIESLTALTSELQTITSEKGE
jgi:predicted component of type VI protein secretion system